MWNNRQMLWKDRRRIKGDERQGCAGKSLAVRLLKSKLVEQETIESKGREPNPIFLFICSLMIAVTAVLYGTFIFFQWSTYDQLTRDMEALNTSYDLYWIEIASGRQPEKFDFLGAGAYNFFSYIAEHYFHQLYWLLSGILVFSFIMTFAAMRRKRFSLHLAALLIISLGSLMSAMMPRFLIVDWYPYSLLLIFGLLMIATESGGVYYDRRFRLLQKEPPSSSARIIKLAALLIIIGFFIYND